MADGRGGYQKPSNPAPVSGPGALSKRTDGAQPIRDLPDADYGENRDYVEAQQGAPLAESAALSPSGAAPGGGGASLVGFGEDSMQPGTPVTAGAGAGAGPGMEALGLASERDDDMRIAESYLPVLEFMANQPGSSDAARN